LRGEVTHARTAPIAAIHLDLRERSMLDDIGLQQRQRVVLGLVGRADHGPDDEIGVHEFHHVAFVAGEQLRPRFAPMPHLGVAQGGQAIRRDAPPDAALAGRRVRLQVLG
jgi:hypothetical protein